jgi:hypothetical protein
LGEKKLFSKEMLFMKSIKIFAFAVFIAILAMSTAQAVIPTGQLVGTTDVVLQGGSNSSVKWRVPAASSFKMQVEVPMDSTATRALYRVYPKGSVAGSTACSSSDVLYPCFEIPINQATNQGQWVPLSFGKTNQWKMLKTGFITVNASNLATTEILSLGRVAFEDMSLSVGKKYQGGIIFYLDSTGQHGLIAALTDIKNSTGSLLGMQWGSYTAVGTTGTAIGTGQANTTAIIASQGAGAYAAKLCDDFVSGAYKDWYLPSKDELALMYSNIGPGSTGFLTNVGGFVSDYYWSSSEVGSGNAWTQYFGSGSQYNFSKSYTLYVRPVRAF